MQNTPGRYHTSKYKNFISNQQHFCSSIQQIHEHTLLVVCLCKTFILSFILTKQNAKGILFKLGYGTDTHCTNIKISLVYCCFFCILCKSRNAYVSRKTTYRAVALWDLFCNLDFRRCVAYS